jgi:hypothetical protein
VRGVRRSRASSEAQRKISVLLTEEVAVAQSRFHFAVGAGNDVSSDQAVTDALASVSASAHSSVNSASFAAN